MSAPPSATFEFSRTFRRRGMGAIGAGIAVLGVLGSASAVARIAFHREHALGLIPLFDLDREGGVPAWFTSLLLLGATGLLVIVAAHKRSAGDAWWRAWLWLAAVTTAASLDEVASIHEAGGELMTRVVPSSLMAGNDWAIVGAVVVAGLALLFRPFWRTLPPPFRRQMSVAVIVYVGCAVGLEIGSNAYAFVHGEEAPSYVAMTVVEDLGEMLGVLLLVAALLQHLADERVTIRMGRAR